MAATVMYTLSLHDALPILGNNPSCFTPAGAGKAKVRLKDTSQCPVESVTWHQAVAFCKKLGDRTDEKAAKRDRKSTRLNSSHRCISYAVFCLKKKKKKKKI